MTSEARFQRLLELLRRLETALRRDGHEYWADWVQRSLREAEYRDAHGLQRFLGAFGGMGSINDIWFLNSPNHRLLSETYSLAAQLWREHDSLHASDRRTPGG